MSCHATKTARTQGVSPQNKTDAWPLRTLPHVLVLMGPTYQLTLLFFFYSNISLDFIVTNRRYDRPVIYQSFSL